MGPSRRTPARVSIVCRRPPVPHAPNELDDPFAVAVDRFGTVYVADLAGPLPRTTSNCTLSSPYFDAVSGVARGTSVFPTLNTAWYGDYPRPQGAAYSSASFPPITWCRPTMVIGARDAALRTGRLQI